MAQTLTGTVDLIRTDLGFHDTLEESIILATIDRVQRRYETGGDSFPLPWFCFDADATVTTTADQRTVDFPSDFVSFDEAWPLKIVDDEGTTHPFVRKPMYFLTDHDDLEGRPEAFDYTYQKLYAFPLADDAYTINFPYYKRLSDLSTATTSPWFDFCEELIVCEVVELLARALRDKYLLSSIGQRLGAAQAEYLRKCESQKHIQKQYIKGSM